MRYQSTQPKRRFLAGVACPKCSAMDSVVHIQLFEPDPDEYIECTQCQHLERRPDPQPISDQNAQLDQNRQEATGTSGTVKFVP